MYTNPYSEITPELLKLSKIYEDDISIDPELYTKYDVKRGLRDLNGKGVLVGLTEISDVCSSKIVDGKSVPMEGELYYRGFLNQATSALRNAPIFCSSANFQTR